MTYATDTFTGDGSTVEFTLTFDYIERDHVEVTRIVTATKARTTLSVIQTGTPTGDQYIWETDTKIKVGTAPTSAQELTIVRDTPEDEQIVEWADGSYIVATDLNTADQQFLYGIQELEDKVEALDGGSTGGAAVKGVTGTAPITVDNTDPQNPIIGSDAITEITGTSPISVDLTDPQKPAISSSAVTTVTGVSPISVDLTDPQQPEISSSAVTAVTGTTPVSIDNSNPQQPDVSVDAITKAQAESDPTNPSWDTDDKLASAGAIDRVFKQVVGDGVGFPGSGNKAKDGQLRVDNTGTEPDLYYWDASLGTPAWVEIAQTGPTGPKGDKGDTGDTGPAPGLQSPPAAATSVALNSDGSVGTPTVSVTKDSSDDLKFDFGIPIGQKGDKGDTGSGVTYKGLIDAVTAAEPTNPDNGDFYVSSAAGTSSWAGTVLIGSRIVYNDSTSSWDTYDPVASQTLQQVCDLDNFTTTDIAIGNTSSSPKIELKNDGSAIYQAGIQADGITLNTGGSASAGLYVRGASSANVATILGDGSAEFTDDVEVGGKIEADGAISTGTVNISSDTTRGIEFSPNGIAYIQNIKDSTGNALEVRAGQITNIEMTAGGAATFAGRLEADQGSFNADVGIIGESGTDTAFFVRDAGQSGSPTTFSVQADGDITTDGKITCDKNIQINAGGILDIFAEDNTYNAIRVYNEDGTEALTATSGGSLTAAGDVVVGGPTDNNHSYSVLRNYGGCDIYYKTTGTSNAIFSGFSDVGSTKNEVFKVATNGSITAAGTVFADGVLSETYVQAGRSTSTEQVILCSGGNNFSGRTSGTVTSYITKDGVGYFKSDVTTDGDLAVDGQAQVGNANQVLVSDNGIFLKDTGNASASNFNIKLDTNGTVNATGTIKSGTISTGDGSKAGVNVDSSGTIDIQRANGSGGKALRVWGGNQEKASISSAGAIIAEGNFTTSASVFATGGVQSGAVSTGSAGQSGVKLVNDGNIVIQKTGTGTCFEAYNSTTKTINFDASGSATFEGAVTATNTAKAWGHVGNAGGLNRGYNISTCVRDSQGEYSITFSTNISSQYYAIVVTPQGPDSFGLNAIVTAQSVSGFSVAIHNKNDAMQDKVFSFIVHG